MELLIGILGAGIGSGIMAIIQAALQRKWKKEDVHDERIDAIVTAQKVLMIDRFKYVARHYINAGEIPLDDKENLKEMYDAYHQLGGNGHLDTTMNEIDRLKVIT